MSTTVKSWKTVDFFGQVAMIIIPLIWGLCARDISLGGFGILFALGAWQAISFIAHLSYAGAPWTARGRKVYGYTFLIVAAVGLLSMIIHELIFIFLFAMLFVGPLMAITYLVISHTEWRRAKAMMLRGRQAL